MSSPQFSEMASPRLAETSPQFGTMSTSEQRLMELDLCENRFLRIHLPNNLSAGQMVKYTIPGSQTPRLFTVTKEMEGKKSVLLSIS